MNIYNTYLKVKFSNGTVRYISIYIYSTCIGNEDDDPVELVDKDTYYFSEILQDYTMVKHPEPIAEDVIIKIY
jgi:hypothetical protein